MVENIWRMGMAMEARRMDLLRSVQQDRLLRQQTLERETAGHRVLGLLLNSVQASAAPRRRRVAQTKGSLPVL